MEDSAFGVRRGDRIELVRMGSDPDPMKPGEVGEVIGWNSDPMFAQIWVKWDSGRGLCLVPGEDQFKVVQRVS